LQKKKYEIMKKKIVYWLCERGRFKMARRISPSLVSEWQGELLARKIAESIDTAGELLARKLTESINTATDAIASFARALQKARELQSAENNNSHNSHL